MYRFVYCDAGWRGTTCPCYFVQRSDGRQTDVNENRQAHLKRAFKRIDSAELPAEYTTRVDRSAFLAITPDSRSVPENSTSALLAHRYFIYPVPSVFRATRAHASDGLRADECHVCVCVCVITRRWSFDSSLSATLRSVTLRASREMPLQMNGCARVFAQKIERAR